MNGKFVKDPEKQKEWLKKSETHTWDETGGSGDRSGMGDWVPTVSYTHLTLPTILLV